VLVSIPTSMVSWPERWSSCQRSGRRWTRRRLARAVSRSAAGRPIFPALTDESIERVLQAA